MNVKSLMIGAVLTVSMISCGWSPTEQEKKTLEDTRKSAIKAEDQVKTSQSEINRLKQQIAQAKAKKEQAERELKKVQDAVQSSPDENNE